MKLVDLGLPSGTKWYDCNLGADSPEKTGSYFSWGETEIKECYSENNSKTYNINVPNISGNKKYDAATAILGDDYRIPTEEECIELINRCSWEWCKLNDVEGFEIFGLNGNSIFLPVTGYIYEKELYGNRYGNYWTGSKSNDEYNFDAYCMYFTDTVRFTNSFSYRYEGRCIRPVLKENNKPVLTYR